MKNLKMEIERIITKKYKQDLKLVRKRGKSFQKLGVILSLIENNYKSNRPLLPSRYCLHKLTGRYKGSWECHIEPDWLLIFTLSENQLKLERTGSHSDLFK